jgi:hypothetical protein
MMQHAVGAVVGRGGAAYCLVALVAGGGESEGRLSVSDTAVDMLSVLT